jgi:hypothetical protein
MAKSNLRRTAFVPRVLLRGAALASVIPACALVACGSDTTGSTFDARTDVAAVEYAGDVAAEAYGDVSPGPGPGLGDVAAEAYGNVFLEAGGVADNAYVGGGDVADVGYGNDAPDVQPDAPDGASDAPTRPDGFLGVAAVAYPAYEAGRG